MFRRYPIIFLLIALLLFGMQTINAQEAKTNNPLEKLDIPESMKETFAKRRIKAEEEEYQELIKKSEEAVKLSDELSRSFEENQKLSLVDTKKLEQLEKLIKKIRKELGAEEEKEEREKETPTSIKLALINVKEKTINLLSELKKTSRYSISVIAVESSNTVWRIVRFLRLSKN